MINFIHLQVLSRRCLRREKERSFEKFFLTKDSEVVLHSPEASLLIAPARDSLFCERARSGMPTCKHSTSPPSRELGNVEPGEAPAKNCFARTATQTVWCAKTGTALNDERDSGSFESPHPPAGYPSIHALVNSLRMFNVRKVVTQEYS